MKHTKRLTDLQCISSEIEDLEDNICTAQSAYDVAQATKSAHDLTSAARKELIRATKTGIGIRVDTLFQVASADGSTNKRVKNE